MIEFEIVGAKPPYYWNLSDGIAKPGLAIREKVQRWLARDPSLPTIVCIKGIQKDPLCLDFAEITTLTYLELL